MHEQSHSRDLGKIVLLRAREVECFRPIITFCKKACIFSSQPIGIRDERATVLDHILKKNLVFRPISCEFWYNSFLNSSIATWNHKLTPFLLPDNAGAGPDLPIRLVRDRTFQCGLPDTIQCTRPSRLHGTLYPE